MLLHAPVVYSATIAEPPLVLEATSFAGVEVPMILMTVHLANLAN